VWETLKNAWKIEDLRKKIIFTLIMLLVYRVGTYVPVPGVDSSFIKAVIDQSGLLGFLNIISGGAFANFTVFAMSITPYINASIIMQLLTVAIPKLEQLAKEGEEGSTITLKHAPANVQLTVPDFTKMTQEEILAKNYHRSFDIRFTEGPEYKEGYEGKVYEQSLKAGTKTASGSVITLTLGPKQISSDPGNDLGES
jgi:hypothetical protein